LNDQMPGIYDGLGQCYHALNNYEEALENFQVALTKAPNNVEFLRNRSECFYSLKMFEESANDLSRALA
jgi:tetratricopeptide (TPR) repeat protein